jgi:hypothetical protein
MILEHDLRKIDAVVEALTQKSCLRGVILKHFAESGVKENCEMCEHCLGKGLTKEITAEKNEDYVPDDVLKSFSHIKPHPSDIPLLKILKSLMQDYRIPRDDAVKIFTGMLRKSSGKWKFQLQSYGILPQFKDKEEVLEKIMNWCIDNALVQEEVDGGLRITRKGIDHVMNVGEKKDG